TGGSTGYRAVTIYDWDGMATMWLSTVRRVLISRPTDPELRAAAELSIAWGTAAHPSPATATVARAVHNPTVVNLPCPVPWPLERMVAQLNEHQPLLLGGYGSALAVLAREAQAGRLRISPVQVGNGGEPLLPEGRAAIEAAWGRPVMNLWGASEI